jgi:uncharacterized protein YgbK (DUF1537 family)
MEQQNHNLLLAFYGDDFTGSTDALEFLSRAGIKTVLFIDAPTEAQLKNYKNLGAIGVAGMTRAMAPDLMEKTLELAFSKLKELKPLHVHYKVCSTFDSSPKIGSIGKAIDTGAKVFGNKITPLLVAAPLLGRYCMFGNLFARMGIGSQGNIYRLDRHPSMSKHPTTPATESDLRVHLSQQTSKKIALLNILEIAKDKNERFEALNKLKQENAEIILFDALDENHIQNTGELIDSLAEDGKSLFSAGSSGIEMALGSYWNKQGVIQQQKNWPKAKETDVLLVASGSCSPVTSTQIVTAVKEGFVEIGIDTFNLANSSNNDELINAYANQAAALLEQGKSVIVHTSTGPDDVRLEETTELFKQNKKSTSEIFGTALGQIVKAILYKIKLQRIVIAGGDTSSYAARALGIEAVEMIAPISPGAPLCKAYAPNSPANGVEVNFKGGQVGHPNYFTQVLKGNQS